MQAMSHCLGLPSAQTLKIQAGRAVSKKIHTELSTVLVSNLFIPLFELLLWKSDALVTFSHLLSMKE